MGFISAIAGIAGASKQKKLLKRQAAQAAEAAAAQKEAQRIEQVRANVNAQKERRQQFREARLRRAQILASAANAGALGSSTASGAIGSVNTQFASNIGQINEAQGFAGAISAQNERAAGAQTEINRLEGKRQVAQANTELFQTIGGLGDSIFQRKGGFTTLFNGNIFKRS